MEDIEKKEIATGDEPLQGERNPSDENFTPYHRPLPKGARALAVKVLSRFERSDSYLDKLMDYQLRTGNMNDPDKRLFKELVTGVIRWRGKLDWVLVGFYQGDFLKCLNLVKNAMRVALYQILFLNKIPIFAAINESVELVKRIQGERTAGIVNGVLRNIARNIENIRYPDPADDPVYFLSVIYSHPRWIVKRMIEIFGEEAAERVLFKNNQRPYIPLRVNRLRSDVQLVKKFLIDHEIPFQQSPYLQECLLLKTTHGNVAALEIFQKGQVSVQDPSASVAALLARPKPGDRVIDVCSSPGGKTFFMAEMMEDTGEIVANDIYPSKIKLIEEGIQRLGLSCIRPSLADGRALEAEPADVVFLDAPCSGLGVISKKPDIKWKREREDMPELLKLQRELLDSAQKLVKPSGVLVYSTCTVEPEENTQMVRWFLEKYPEFEIEPADRYVPREMAKDGFYQSFQHLHYADGAFGARLKRVR